MRFACWNSMDLGGDHATVIETEEDVDEEVARLEAITQYAEYKGESISSGIVLARLGDEHLYVRRSEWVRQ